MVLNAMSVSKLTAGWQAEVGQVQQGVAERGRYRPTGVLGKGVGNSQNASEMRQKCVKNASEWVLFYWGKRGTSKMCHKSVKIAPKMRGTPLGENTFWTIPKGGIRTGLPVHCLSARPDRQPYCHTNATSPPFLKDNQVARDNHLPAQCRSLQSLRHNIVIPVATQMSLGPVCLPPV